MANTYVGQHVPPSVPSDDPLDSFIPPAMRFSLWSCGGVEGGEYDHELFRLAATLDAAELSAEVGQTYFQAVSQLSREGFLRSLALRAASQLRDALLIANDDFSVSKVEVLEQALPAHRFAIASLSLIQGQGLERILPASAQSIAGAYSGYCTVPRRIVFAASSHDELNEEFRSLTSHLGPQKEAFMKFFQAKGSVNESDGEPANSVAELFLQPGYHELTSKGRAVLNLLFGFHQLRPIAIGLVDKARSESIKIVDSLNPYALLLERPLNISSQGGSRSSLKDARQLVESADVEMSPSVEQGALESKRLAERQAPHLYIPLIPRGVDPKQLARPFGTHPHTLNSLLAMNEAVRSGEVSGATAEVTGRLDFQFVRWVTGSDALHTGMSRNVETLYQLPLPSGASYRFRISSIGKMGLQFRALSTEELSSDEKMIVQGAKQSMLDGHLYSLLCSADVSDFEGGELESALEATGLSLEAVLEDPALLPDEYSRHLYKKEWQGALWEKLRSRAELYRVNSEDINAAIHCDLDNPELLGRIFDALQDNARERIYYGVGRSYYEVPDDARALIIEEVRRRVDKIRNYEFARLEQEKIEGSKEYQWRQAREELGYDCREEGVALDLLHLTMDVVCEYNFHRLGKVPPEKPVRNYDHPERFSEFKDIDSVLEELGNTRAIMVSIHDRKTGRTRSKRYSKVSSDATLMKLDRQLVEENESRLEGVLEEGRKRVERQLEHYDNDFYRCEACYLKLLKLQQSILPFALKKKRAHAILREFDRSLEGHYLPQSGRHLSRFIKHLRKACRSIEREYHKVLPERDRINTAEKIGAGIEQQAKQLSTEFKERRLELLAEARKQAELAGRDVSDKLLMKEIRAGFEADELALRRRRIEMVAGAAKAEGELLYVSEVHDYELSKFIFGIDAAGVLRFDEERFGERRTSKVSHSEINSGRHTFGAGELIFKRHDERFATLGEWRDWSSKHDFDVLWELHEENNGSGHYRPPAESLKYVSAVIRRELEKHPPKHFKLASRVELRNSLARGLELKDASL